MLKFALFYRSRYLNTLFQLPGSPKFMQSGTYTLTELKLQEKKLSPGILSDMLPDRYALTAQTCVLQNGKTG